jgi:hypothetical protein
VPGLADGEHAAAEQAAADFGQPQPDVVVPAHGPRAALQRQHPLRGRGQHTRPAHLVDQRADVGRVQVDVGIDVQAREADRGVIAGPQGSLPRDRRKGKDAHARAERGGNLGRIVGAAVRDHDDHGVAGGRERRDPAEQPAYHPTFVMRGNYNSSHDKTV